MPLLLTAATDANLNKSTIASIFANQTIGPDSWMSVAFALLAAFVVGLFIFWVYRLHYRGVLYNANFGLTLVMLTLITTPVVMCIKHSIQLSMGMVGALSIVRFRTAVKDPLDTAYMFWALTMGILLGAEMWFMAAATVVGIALLATVLNRMQFRQTNSFLLVIHYLPGAEQLISSALRGVRNQRIRSRTMSRGGAEMTVEVRMEKQGALLNKLLSLDGVLDATMVAYQPE